MKTKQIKRAIISVSNKSYLKIILPILKTYKIEIISSGGTYKKIKSMNYKCIEVSDYTGFPEILNGRIKTLHPKIHAGILNIRKNKQHKKTLREKNIPNIDLVIIDLYPFEKQLTKKNNFENLVEYIDIGGASLIRSAAKNFKDVTVISSLNDYKALSNELKKNKGNTSINFRKLMSAKAFAVTAYYDSVISNYFNKNLNINFPEKKIIHGKLSEHLRYGENPHQKSSIYKTSDFQNLNQLNGKKLSYNNYNDIYCSLDILSSFKKNEGIVIIKHANPCGVSVEKNQLLSFENAFNCDPISAFGGVVAINSRVTKKLAIKLNKIFFEVIVAKSFEKSALKILKKKKNIRLVNFDKLNLIKDKNYLFFGNSFLLQENDNKLFNKKLKIVTKKKPSNSQLNSLKFAFNICKFVKSNAIVLANKKSVIGIGSGQPSRLDSCKIASEKALKFLPNETLNSVAASDAFFPFPDGIEELINLGVKAIIQPGGSINDDKIINAANKAKIVMVFTGTRHFKH